MCAFRVLRPGVLVPMVPHGGAERWPGPNMFAAVPHAFRMFGGHPAVRLGHFDTLVR